MGTDNIYLIKLSNYNILYMSVAEKYLNEKLIFKSTNPNKKLMVKYNGKTIHFGSSKNEHYFDKTGIWKHLDHLDEKRKKDYYARHSKIKNKNGEYVINNADSPSYWSYRIFWT